MISPISLNIRNKISNRLLNLEFIKKDSSIHKTIKNFVENPSFINKIEEIVQSEDFSCVAILRLCEDILDKLSDGNAPEDWLYYIYQFSLHKAFPNAVENELNNELEKPSIIYLKILEVFTNFEKSNKIKNIHSKYPLVFLTQEEENNLKNPSEYKRFKKVFDNDYLYEMMKLNKEITGHNTLEHISGVSYIALHIGRQLFEAGLPVDLGRVCGSAVGHDIGKFGCKGEESKRVPYLHYYYTDLWFKKHNIQYIGHIATNHSTWDLELENLSLESLVLIYSDFRVKNRKIKNKKREMHIFSLAESFEIVLNKLDNLDEAKEKRYRRVYAKLRDFENFMVDLGINVDFMINSDIKEKKYFSLMQAQDVIQNIKYQSINHNIHLMYKLRNESSLNAILELARSESDWKNLRGYIQIFEEYSTYLTQNQKLITINFLYELLIHKEEDIRKQCAALIGRLIATFDEEYRKEVPKNVYLEQPEMRSNKLLKKYLQLFLYPDHKIIEVHREWIIFSLRIMLASLFFNSEQTQRKKYRDIVLNYYEDIDLTDSKIQFYLLQTVKYIPYTNEIDKPIEKMHGFILNKLTSNDSMVRISALERTYNLLFRIDKNSDFVKRLRVVLTHDTTYSDIPAENFLKLKIAQKISLKEDTLTKFFNNYKQDSKKTSEIYLKNLKGATDWISKKVHIELLLEQVIDYPEKNRLHTAMHFCNLIKVSAVENVRNHAGEALLKITPFLSLEQRNDVTVELLRALEIQGYHFTKYIPYYLGQIMLYLPPNELDELIDDLIDKIKQSNTQINFLLLKTIGITIQYYPNYKDIFDEDEEVYKNRLVKMLGILLNGLASYDVQVKQEAFKIIGMEIFGSSVLDLEQKNDIFQLVGKKILTLSPSKEVDELLFLNNSASLNDIYRFISDYSFFKGQLTLGHHQKIAFFPGSFDPFSLSHKEIAREIRNHGFEVYLAVDEFSWSKKTQPHKLRREIINMSIADELSIYLYPEDLPINIANPNDLKTLRESFLDSEVYIVVGSDVVLNASSYKNNRQENSIHNFPHVIFDRRSFLSSDKDDIKLEKAIANIEGEVVRLTLSPQYEDISSTQIRSYIDDNRDISQLIDPLVQKYIYEYGVYRREPQYKTLIQTKSLNVDLIEDIDDNLIEQLCNDFFDNNSAAYSKLKMLKNKLHGRIILIRDIKNNGAILGFSAFHWIRSSMLFEQFKNNNISEYIRENSIGRNIVLDGIFVGNRLNTNNLEQILLTETLSFCLSKDYTYAIFNNIINDYSSSSLQEILRLQGFQKLPYGDQKNPIFVVSMTNPCTLILDLETIIKEPFKSNLNVRRAIIRSRKRLQLALTKLYPGQLILSFDREMLHENLIEKICKVNNVSTEQLTPRILGANMCVPFGSIINGHIIPNTVTKSMHTEKMFSPDIKDFTINAFPYYMSLENQIKMLRSFNRPVILIDDLLNKGYRLKAIDPLLKKENIEVKQIIVGILSGRGKELMDIQNREVDCAYFLPNLKVWFNEKSIYPFIGGDTVWRGVDPQGNLLPSINFVLPYASPTFIKGTSNDSIYNLSETSIQNAIDILTTLEKEYQTMHERNLTLKHLGEVFVSPRCPDRGKSIDYDLHLKPSRYLKNDLAHLKRIENTIKN